MNAPTSTFRSGYAPVNGLQMYYEVHGEGRPLVLIHGGGSTIETNFSRVLPQFAKNRMVIAVELQAHGRTKDRDTPSSFKQDADDVAALLGYLEIDKADILGFSNGGQTALQLGMSHADVVNKLVIISCFYKRSGAVDGFWEIFPNATMEQLPPPYHEAYLKVNNDPEGLQRMFDRDNKRMLNFVGWTDEDVATIKAPTLVIAGNQDVVKPEHAAEMAGRIEGAQLLIVPGNHGSFIGEVLGNDPKSRIPEMMVGMIEEFLDR